jgi:hypothetical protein
MQTSATNDHPYALRMATLLYWIRGWKRRFSSACRPLRQPLAGKSEVLPAQHFQCRCAAVFAALENIHHNHLAPPI